MLVHGQLLLGIRRVCSAMPRARNRPCMQYSLSTRLGDCNIQSSPGTSGPRRLRQADDLELNLERGRVSRAKESARMAKCALDLQDLRSASNVFHERLR